MHRRRMAIRAALAAALALAAGTATAGLDEARQYLAEARASLAKEQNDDVETNLMLAEAELEDVSGPEKDALAAEIDALKKQMAGAENAEEAARLRQDVEGQINDLKGAIDDWIRFQEYAEELDDLLADDDTTAVLSADEIAKTRKTMATYRKVAMQKQAAAAIDELKQAVDGLEPRMEEYVAEISGDSPAARDNAIQSYGYNTQRIRELLDMVDPANAEAAAQIAKFEKIDAEFNNVYAKGMADEVLDQITRYWEMEAYEYEGWDKETASPTFEELVKIRNEANGRLGLPRNADLVESANHWLDVRNGDELYQLTKDDPRIVAVVAGVKKQRDEALAKLLKNAEKILAEAEKTQLDQDKRDRLSSFAEDDLRLSLDGAPEQAALEARARKVVDAWDEQVLGAQRRAEAAMVALTEQANNNWPDMVDRFKFPDDEFDPNRLGAFKGKTILLSGVFNRMGWDFAPGEYDFAMTINGVAVAGRYDKAIKAHIDDVLRRTMTEALPEETPCEVVAVVEGKGKIKEIARVSETGNVEGLNYTANATSHETVDCVLLKIVGLKIGPVAAVAPR